MELTTQSNASEHEDGVDMISDLPDPILHLILSSLPTTEEVIRTSILSTRWRYLWTLISSIDIDYSRGMKFDKSKFKKFVYNVLENNSLDLDSFSLSCADIYSRWTVYQWIEAAVSRNIKQLHLSFSSEDWFKHIELPYCLVTCDSLQVLRVFLYEQRRLILPNFTWFQALRVLELKNVELYKGYLVKSFLESCPLLEDLSLIDCEINNLKVLCISCPNLKRLRLDNRNIFSFEDLYDDDTLCGCIMIVCPKLVFFEFGAFVAPKYVFRSLGLVKKVVIHPEEFPSEYMDYMFRGNCSLESLSTSIYILCSSLFPSGVPVSLPNLKTLELTIGIDIPIISDFIGFLTRLPHLESLHLIIEENICWEDWKLDDAETKGILTQHLKRVKFLIFYKQQQQQILDLARCLLEHGNALEEMVFRWKCDEAEFHERSMVTMKEVSKFSQSFLKCQTHRS
ncbi:hypothetical protein Lser_V15G31894 [Lactuca serriola]